LQHRRGRILQVVGRQHPVQVLRGQHPLLRAGLRQGAHQGKASDRGPMLQNTGNVKSVHCRIRTKISKINLIIWPH
jgi:hypothetical protein